jgi:hypothetical protein
MMGISVGPQTDKSYELMDNLLAATRSPEATQARLDQLWAATKAAKQQEDAARAATAELVSTRDRTKKELAEERRVQDQQLTQQREAWLAEEARRKNALEEREKAAEALLVQAEGDAKHNAALRRELEGKLKRIAEIAA